MPSCETLNTESQFRALFVGDSGSGKTVAACSFPKKIEVEDFDGRIRGLLGAEWIDRKGISYNYYPPKKDGLITELNNKFEVMMMQGRNGQLDLRTHVTDSITNQTFAFISQSIKLTHGEDGKKKGKWIGMLAVPDPADYGFESAAMNDYVAFLKSIPIPNVIMTAHIIDRFGKANPADPYSETVVVGERLSIRDKIGVNIQTHFDHIFKFDRQTINNRDIYTVQFRGGMARTSFAQLPSGIIDITGKNFYEVMQSYLKTSVEIK